MPMDREYTEMDYWNRRGSPNGRFMNKKKEEATKKHIAYVKKYVGNVLKALDFGCGVGRIFPGYNGVVDVVGYDISSLYVDQITEKAKEFNFHFKHVVGNEVDNLPFNTSEFQITVAVSVLLHQTPKNIVSIMRELIRVSDMVIVVSWQDLKKPFAVPGDEEKKFTYCFNYDYKKICEDEGWWMEGVVIEGNQIYFIYGEGET